MSIEDQGIWSNVDSIKYKEAIAYNNQIDDLFEIIGIAPVDNIKEMITDYIEETEGDEKREWVACQEYYNKILTKLEDKIAEGESLSREDLTAEEIRFLMDI